jgi:hypothetical protein
MRKRAMPIFTLVERLLLYFVAFAICLAAVLNYYALLIVTFTALREWGPLGFGLFVSISFALGIFIFKRLPIFKRLLFSALVVLILDYLVAAILIIGGAKIHYC